MEPLDLARWQFGITTVYHFLFVPLTIGTSMHVAIMQTMWVRTGDEKWLKSAASAKDIDQQIVQARELIQQCK